VGSLTYDPAIGCTKPGIVSPPEGVLVASENTEIASVAAPRPGILGRGPSAADACVVSEAKHGRPGRFNTDS
jgi:hypothetical protein